VIKKYGLMVLFVLFLLIAKPMDLKAGTDIFNNFKSFSLTMIKFVPLVFILIGIFEVWIDQETIEKHLGEESKAIAYLWAIILAGTTVGGLYVALPVAKSIFDKGAKLSIVFTYLGAAAVARIPMTLFEMSFLGITFTLIRLFVSIPLIIFSSILIEKFYKRNNIQMRA
jgi:uncharacterized membrane protein YraQ (UPF0718 family)